MHKKYICIYIYIYITPKKKKKITIVEMICYDIDV